LPAAYEGAYVGSLLGIKVGPIAVGIEVDGFDVGDDVGSLVGLPGM